MKKMKDFDQDKWLKFIQSSGIQLRELNDQGLPCSIGSGCLMNIGNRRFILTVFHVTKHSKKWCAQIKFNDEVQQIEVYFLKQFNYIADFDYQNNRIKEVEFAFVEVNPDLECFFHNRNYLGQTLELRHRSIFNEFDVIDPNQNAIYGFSGDIMPALLDKGETFVTDHHTYPGLKYDRTEGDFHCFKLPVEHPGHDYFRGCSGAPIVDTEGKIASLVSCSPEGKNEIYGINLSKCLRTIVPALGVFL